MRPVLLASMLATVSLAATGSTAIPTGHPAGQLTDFAFLPGGNVISTGLDGVVKLTTPDGNALDLVRIPVEAAGVIGLAGIEPANDYADSGIVYTAYTHRDGGGEIAGRLSRWTMNDVNRPTRLTHEVVVLDGISTEGWHSLGMILAAPDGTLFVGSGDGSTPVEATPSSLRAQDPASPNGKILRVYPDGSGVPGNPFYEPEAPSSWASRVYALGLRNPFRFTLRPGSAELWVGDVGWNSWEELNVVEGGGNYGWPCWEGRQLTPGFRELPECRRLAQTLRPESPLLAYRHPPGGVSVTGGVFAPDRSVAGGRYVFGDFVQGQILTVDPNGTPDADGDLRETVIAVGTGSPVRFRVGPDGEVYYADLGSGTILRLVPSLPQADAGLRIGVAIAALVLLLALAIATAPR